MQRLFAEWFISQLLSCWVYLNWAYCNSWIARNWNTSIRRTKWLCGGKLEWLDWELESDCWFSLIVSLQWPTLSFILCCTSSLVSFCFFCTWKITSGVQSIGIWSWNHFHTSYCSCLREVSDFVITSTSQWVHFESRWWFFRRSYVSMCVNSGS